MVLMGYGGAKAVEKKDIVQNIVKRFIGRCDIVTNAKIIDKLYN